MYCSLDKIDVVAERAGGAHVLVQTDHRTPTEVGADQALATVFALTRMLLPRSSQYAGATVRYACSEAAHPVLATVAAACGAELTAAGAAVALSAGARQPTADLADAALTTIAQRVMGERGLALDEDGLEALLATLPAPPAHADDELGYYTAVVELAAVTGAVLRAQFGGRWVDDPRQMSVIPFVFALSRDGGLTNAVGKAQKYFRHGDHESPIQLLRAAEDAGRDAGPLLFTLKPSGWEPAATMICAPIATGLDAAGADVPLMVFGHDRPNTFAMMTHDAPEAGPPAVLRERALRNLAEVEVAVEPLELGAVSVRVVHDSYFAAEKILDQAFLRRLHAELACELLAVAVPAKSRLLVTRGIASVEAIGAFMAVVRGIYDEDEGGRQLSPTVFLVSDGAIVGVASAAAPKKRGFWARLFGRS